MVRSTYSLERAEQVVWEDLKNYHKNAEWRSGVYESDKLIRTYFEIENGETGEFYYSVNDKFYYSRARILVEYDTDLTNDIFVLASHFNNLLSHGRVVINPESRIVEYQIKRSVLIPLLYPIEIEEQLYRHFAASEDVRYGFQRLIKTRENPSFIIAEVLEKNQPKD